jgi:PAS domain S-box-containing protein
MTDRKATEDSSRSSPGWLPGLWGRLAVLLVFAVSLTLGWVLVVWADEARIQDERRTASLAAATQAGQLEAFLESSLGAASAMEALVRAAGGIPAAYQTRADEILLRHPGVRSLELQPGGVGQRVAPQAGNADALGFNVLEDPQIGHLSRQIVESREAGVVAPVSLWDGTPGAFLRLPVFFPPQGEAAQFWGFVSVGLPLELLVEAGGLDGLGVDGYRYSLHVPPGRVAEPLLAGVPENDLEAPVIQRVRVPGDEWRLAIVPATGWGSRIVLARDATLALLAALLLTFLAGGLEGLRSARVRADAAAGEAAEQRDLLRTVLGSMAEGVAAFDSELRLSVYNERWAAIRDYPEELVMPGTPLEAFVNHDARRGVYGEVDADAATRQEMERVHRGELPDETVVVPGGRVLEVRGEALPDGGLVHTVTDVTEQYRARERFRVLFESSPDGYFLIQKGLVVDCNSAALGLMGGDEKSEVVGARLSEYLGGELGAAALRDLFRRADRDGEVREDWTLPRKDLDPIPFEVTVRRVDLTPGDDALLIVLHDLRERREMERALRESQQFLKGVVDHSSALISAQDLEGRYILVNPQWQRVMGISRGNAVGRTDRDLFAEEVAVDRERTDREALERGEPITIEEQTWVAGRARDFLTVVFPIMGSRAQPEAVCRVSTDVTPLKEVQAELEVARDRAQQADRAKGDFLANMSHEIRTPMNAIIGLTHLVLKTDLNPRQRDQLMKLEAASRSLLGILNDILDFSKIEAGMLDMERVPFHLEEVLGNVGDLFAMRAQDKGLEFLVRVDPRTPVRLLGDPLRLGQVLTNLVSNAVKFTDQGEIVIRVEPQRVSTAGALLRFSVRDTGIGLSPEQASNLFRAFSQADTSTTRRYGGTGLGLAICRRLVEMMGGEIGVESLEGEGSTFHFTAHFELSSDQLAATGRVPDLNGRRVLVADDNESSRMILQEVLEGFGVEVGVVSTGEEALKEVRRSAAAGDPYEVAILDWRMPGMDGFDVAQRLAMDDDLPVRPASVLITAHGREDILTKDQRKEEFVEAVLLKPATPSILLETLTTVLGVEMDDVADRPARRMLARRRRRAPAEADKVEGTRVLLVEDNEVNREVALGLLGEAGVEVETAAHGREALQALRREPAGFDAVLMDVHMPEMDGYDATREIRDDPELEWIPIVAMTAGALEEDRMRCLEAGMDDHVAKPVDLEDLFGKLARWIEKGRERGGERARAARVRPFSTEAEDQESDEAGVDPDALRAAGVNPLRGLRNAGGNESLYRRILRRFVATQSEAPDGIRQALLEGDEETAVRMAHTLKGLAGTVGADDLRRRAEELEAALREGDDPNVRRRLASVEADLVQIRAAMISHERGPDAGDASWMDDGPGQVEEAPSTRTRPKAVPVPLSGDDPADVARQLASLLEAGDTRAVDMAAELAGKLEQTPLAAGAARVAESARNFEFEGARLALRSLQERLNGGDE